MQPIEIIVIIASISIVLGVFLSWVYKKAHHLPTGECGYCSGNSQQLIKKYRKFIKDNNL